MSDEEILDGACLTLEQLCAAAALDRDWLVRRVEEGLIPASGALVAEWRFTVATSPVRGACARSSAPTRPRPNSRPWWPTCWRRWTRCAPASGAAGGAMQSGGSLNPSHVQRLTIVTLFDMDRADLPTAMAGTSAFDALLTQCRDLASAQLDAAIAGMLAKADEALTELATKTQDRETQKRYLEVQGSWRARSARSSRSSSTRASSSEFQQRTNKATKIGGNFSDVDLSSLELSLVADDDLEETLKFNEMAAKLRRICEEEINALDQRVGVLLGRRRPAVGGRTRSARRRSATPTRRPAATWSKASSCARCSCKPVRRPRARRHPLDLQGAERPAGAERDPAQDPLRRAAQGSRQETEGQEQGRRGDRGRRAGRRGHVRRRCRS